MILDIFYSSSHVAKKLLQKGVEMGIQNGVNEGVSKGLELAVNSLDAKLLENNKRNWLMSTGAFVTSAIVSSGAQKIPSVINYVAKKLGVGAYERGIAIGQDQIIATLQESLQRANLFELIGFFNYAVSLNPTAKAVKTLVFKGVEYCVSKYSDYYSVKMMVSGLQKQALDELIRQKALGNIKSFAYESYLQELSTVKTILDVNRIFERIKEGV